MDYRWIVNGLYMDYIYPDYEQLNRKRIIENWIQLAHAGNSTIKNLKSKYQQNGDITQPILLSEIGLEPGSYGDATTWVETITSQK